MQQFAIYRRSHLVQLLFCIVRTNKYIIVKKLLIINLTTFGRLTDSYMWCKYLKDKFDITLICPDAESRVEMDGVKIKFIHSFKNRKVQEVYLFLISLLYCLNFKGSILIVYFRHAAWLKRIFTRKKMILDIRTFSVHRSEKFRKVFDQGLFAASRVYDHVTVISNGLRDKLDLPCSKTTILPLGSDPISSIDTSFDQLKLLYVGILSGRNIEKTITGIKYFKDRYPNSNITYDIVGDGHYGELEELRQLVTNLGLDGTVMLHGRVPYIDLKPFFDRSNIGVSFVPKTDFYQFQPPTKTFEYIISGLYTIATSTYCNSEVVNSDNGILIDDSSEEFANALVSISNNTVNIDHNKIRESLSSYKWKNIVDGTLCPVIDNWYAKSVI